MVSVGRSSVSSASRPVADGGGLPRRRRLASCSKIDLRWIVKFEEKTFPRLNQRGESASLNYKRDHDPLNL